MAHSADNGNIQKELLYYKTQLDYLSGESIKAQYQLAQMTNQITRLRNAFTIMVEAQDAFTYYSTVDHIYDQVLELILQRMHMDKVALLQEDARGRYKPIGVKGFGCKEVLNDPAIDLPNALTHGKGSLWVNGQSEIKEDIFPLRQWLGCPFLVAVSFGEPDSRKVLSAARSHERKPLSYSSFDESDVFSLRSIAGVLSSIESRLEQHREIEQERTRIARDMHDDIGSELSKISFLSELILRNGVGGGQTGQHIQKIKQAANEVIENLGNIVWTLNPLNNTLPDLVMYLHEFTVDYLELHDLECAFTTCVIPAVPLGHEIRKNILMVVKEALRNVVKHANANSVVIELDLVEDTLMISIRDNGCGLKTMRKFGNGLSNMEQRISDINGVLRVNSRQGKGTLVRISVPLHSYLK